MLLTLYNKSQNILYILLMKYDDHKIEDLIVDLDFIRWVINPTSEDITFWEQWIKDHPDKEGIVEEARQMVIIIHERIYSMPDGEIIDNSKATVFRQIRKSKNRSYILRMTLAAGLTIIIISFTILLLQIFSDNQHFYYETAYGETRRIILPDNSVVTLNANSSLKVPENWSNLSQRNVWLSGEAFFEIRKTDYSDFPAEFIIHTDSHLNIKVLGTSFNVNDRHGKAEVVLNTGKVEVFSNKTDRKVTITPGESITYSAASQDVQKKIVDPEKYSNWINNTLIFEDEQLIDIVQRIHDVFGVQLVFKNFELRGKSFTGSTPYDNLDILFITLAKSYDLDIQKKGNKIFFVNN